MVTGSRATSWRGGLEPNFGDGHDIKAAGVDNADIFSSIAKISVERPDPRHRRKYHRSLWLCGAGNRGDEDRAERQPDFAECGKWHDNDPSSLRYNVAGTVDVRVFEIA